VAHGRRSDARPHPARRYQLRAGHSGARLSHDPVFENWANLVNNIEGDGGMSLKNFRKDIVISVHNLQGSQRCLTSFFARGCLNTRLCRNGCSNHERRGHPDDYVAA